MSEDKKTNTNAGTNQGAANVVAKSLYGSQTGGQNSQGGQGGQRKPGGGRGPRRDDRRDKEKDEFEQRILEVARVTRVMAGGKRMNFRACVAIGDKKGNVGVGLGKGADVTMAVNKAVNRAKKTMINVPMINETIPHEVRQKMGAALILFKPAKKGRGVIAGGVARIILELAGVNNVTSKTLGSNNKINNARCTIAALASLHREEPKPAKDAAKTETEKKEIVKEDK